MICPFCEIFKAGNEEYIEFLNWLSTKPWYEQIICEYIEDKQRGNSLEGDENGE